MTARRRRAAAVAAIVGSSLGSPLHGQTAVTLGASASIVEYEGFLVSGAATLTPALRYDTPTLSIVGQGGWTVFESGNQIFQGTAAAAWLTSPGQRWRVELSGAAGASKYADEPGSGHALLRSRLHLVSAGMGGWAGAAAGAVSAGPAESPVEIEVGVWGAREGLMLVGTVTGAWLGGDHHVDLLGAARWTRNRIELETRVGARPWTESGENIGEAKPAVYGEISALLSLTPRIALALGGGSYPADPVRRVLAARYATAGFRLAILPPKTTPLPLLATGTLATTRIAAASAPEARLEIDPGGPLRTLRVSVPGARSVELMADFTDWQPVPLTRVEGGTWEVRLPLTPGVHRLNVRMNGGDWLVPAGARPEPGEFGGAVGVIIVR